MAAIPWAGGKRAKALMVKPEKAKKIPATSPQPSAEMKVKTKVTSVIPLNFILSLRGLVSAGQLFYEIFKSSGRPRN